jgi:hypothetical protein
MVAISGASDTDVYSKRAISFAAHIRLECFDYYYYDCY